MNNRREWHRHARFFFPFSSLLLLVAAFLDWGGFFSSWENRALSGIVPSPTPSPGTIFLTMVPGTHGLRSLDVALALRGLGMLHPRCIVIDAPVEEEADGVKILPNLLSLLEGDPKTPIRVILPLISSPESRYAPLPIRMLGSNPCPTEWPLIQGKSDATGGSFLPQRVEKLQLFGKLPGSYPVGSCWWLAQPGADPRAHSLPGTTLILSRFLLLPNHAVLQISGSGAWSGPAFGDLRTVPLEDFLLGMELRERGTIRPEFDSLWKGNTVVIGSATNRPEVLAFNQFLRETTLRRLPPSLQILFAAGCILLVLILAHAGPTLRILLGFLLLAVALFTGAFFLGRGMLIPVLPVLALVLSLLLPWDVPVVPGTPETEQLK